MIKGGGLEGVGSSSHHGGRVGRWAGRKLAEEVADLAEIAVPWYWGILVEVPMSLIAPGSIL